MAKLVKTTGEVIEITPENKSDFSLKELQALVDGYIEIYRTKEKVFVWNENGLNKRLPENETATVMLYAELDGFKPVQMLVGDVLICNNNELK